MAGWVSDMMCECFVALNVSSVVQRVRARDCYHSSRRRHGAWVSAHEREHVVVSVFRSCWYSDLTTSNFMVEPRTRALYVIDFGLSQVTTLEEDFAGEVHACVCA